MKAMRQAWGEALATMAEEDPRVLVLDGDVANSTKADTVAQRVPEQFLQMGIAEQNLVGAAVGLATMGYIPWLSSFTVFLTHRALDPVRMLAAQTGANVKIAASYSGLLTGLTGRTHQDVQDLAIMRAMPGMTVLAPADAAECVAMARWACEYQGPVYLRLARDPGPAVFDDDVRFVPGVMARLREGGDLTLVSTGVQTARVLAAAELLDEAGVQARVVHMPCLKPLDEESLLAELHGSPLIVTVEEHTILGGLGGLVAELVAGNGARARVHRLGLRDVWGESAPNDDLLDIYGLSAEKVAAEVVSLTGRSSAAVASAAS